MPIYVCSDSEPYLFCAQVNAKSTTTYDDEFQRTGETWYSNMEIMYGRLRPSVGWIISVLVQVGSSLIQFNSGYLEFL